MKKKTALFFLYDKFRFRTKITWASAALYERPCTASGLSILFGDFATAGGTQSSPAEG